MRKTQLIIALAAVGFAGSAMATNGYFAHGYGTAAKGMGGAGIAYPQDALAAATNPAGMVHVGNRIDLGMEIFVPDRGFSYGSGSPDGNGSGAMESWFPVPEFGYNRMINENTSLGVSVFGNGGMNTTYADGDHPFTVFPGVPGGGDTIGIDLMQMFIAPTIAHKVNSQFSVGATLNLVVQSFASTGLEGFGQPDNGHEFSYGASARLGALYKINDMVTFGATYQTKTDMSKFDDYAVLFPNNGEFDLPASYGVGVAFRVNENLDIALDVMRIEYGEVNPTMNSATFGLFASNEHGFGWENQTVFKLGASYKYNDGLVLRAGLNYGEQPIDGLTAAAPLDIGFNFNTLAPGVVETHLTLGFTKKMSQNTELSGFYMHAFNKKVDGVGGLGLGAGTLEMTQDSFGLAYSWKI